MWVFTVGEVYLPWNYKRNSERSWNQKILHQHIFLKQYIFILKSNVIVLHLKEFKVSWPIAFLRCLKITLNRYPGDTVPSSLYLSYISCSKTWDAVRAFNIPSLNRKWCCKFSDVGYKLAFQSRALTKLPQLHTLILVVPV